LRHHVSLSTDHSHRSPGRLFFTLDLDSAVHANDVIFIAMGTPPAEDGLPISGTGKMRHVPLAAQ
jgi:UDP-glucose 6-dehydrogenase